MMEYESYYCDVIISRWEKYTGKTAVLSGNKPPER
jgi:DNA modification methylase